MSSTIESSVPPHSTLPYPPIHKDAKFVVLSDWDDLTDNYGFGLKKRRDLNFEILDGRNTFRDAFREMLDSVDLSFEQCQEILKRDIKLDPGFADFYGWTKDNGVPVVIVSSGMAPLIRAVLSKLIGEEEAERIEIISNDVSFDANGHWHIQYRHPESGFGHDKSQAILPYRKLDPAPLLFFFGDGVSDMSAAKHADVLFVKLKENGESDLATYCDQEGIKYIKFRTFAEAVPIVQAVVSGVMSASEALELGNAPPL